MRTCMHPCLDLCGAGPDIIIAICLAADKRRKRSEVSLSQFSTADWNHLSSKAGLELEPTELDIQGSKPGDAYQWSSTDERRQTPK
jgi:hypothetical protein